MFDSNHVEHPYHFVLRKKVTEATKIYGEFNHNSIIFPML